MISLQVLGNVRKQYGSRLFDLLDQSYLTRETDQFGQPTLLAAP